MSAGETHQRAAESEIAPRQAVKLHRFSAAAKPRSRGDVYEEDANATGSCCSHMLLSHGHRAATGAAGPTEQSKKAPRLSALHREPDAAHRLGRDRPTSIPNQNSRRLLQMNIFRIFTKRALQGSEVADASSQAGAGASALHLLEPSQAAVEPLPAPPLSEQLPEAVPPALVPAVLPAAGPSPRSADATNPSGLPQETEEEQSGTPAPPRRRLPQGLMDLPELRRFLDDNHFGLGRHNGCHFRTADARERGVQAIISEFQNIVALLSAQKQVQVDRLNDALLETENVCDVTTRRLQMAVQKCEREMATLREQIDLASDGQGWVQQPIATYKLGFSQGIKAALDADHLGF